MFGCTAEQIDADRRISDRLMAAMSILSDVQHMQEHSAFTAEDIRQALNRAKKLISDTHRPLYELVARAGGKRRGAGLGPAGVGLPDRPADRRGGSLLGPPHPHREGPAPFPRGSGLRNKVSKLPGMVEQFQNHTA